MSGGRAPARNKGEVTLAKEAAERLRDWLGSGGVIAERHDDLTRVLAHYAKLTRKKVSRKGLYIKGRSYEYEARDDFIAAGLRCRRVPGSGGGPEKGDLRLFTDWDEEYVGEAKRYAKIPEYLTEALDRGHDFTVFREDRGESFVVVKFRRFAELCQ